MKRYSLLSIVLIAGAGLAQDTTQAPMPKPGPGLYVAFASISGHAGLHQFGSSEGLSGDPDVHTSPWGLTFRGLEFRYLPGQRTGFGLTVYELDAGPVEGGSVLDLRAGKPITVSLHWLAAPGARSFSQFTIGISYVGFFGLGAHFEYAIVPAPPLPVELFGRVSGYSSLLPDADGVELCAGARVGLGWWLMRPTIREGRS